MDSNWVCPIKLYLGKNKTTKSSFYHIKNTLDYLTKQCYTVSYAINTIVHSVQ